MIVLGNLLIALSTLLHALFGFASTTLLVRIVLSWINPSPPPGLIRTVISALYQLTDPVLNRIRRALPFLVVGGIDLSPIALFLGLGFVDSFLTGTLAGLGATML